MGWYDNMPGGGLPQSPLGGPADPFGAAVGELGLPGMPTGGLPPSPFSGGAGQWPAGVPNPFGLPSPGDMAQTIGNWFSNPYNNQGSQPNPSPYNGINPYGTQVSGGNTNPWDPKSTGATYRPPDPNALTPGGWSFAGSTQANPLGGQGYRPNDPFATGDTATVKGVRPGWNTLKAPPILKPAGWQGPQHSQTLDRYGGGWGTGPLGQRHQQGTANVGGGPNWHDVPWGSNGPARNPYGGNV